MPAFHALMIQHAVAAALVPAALAGLWLRRWKGAPLAAHLGAGLACFAVLLLLKAGGWPDMGERVLKAAICLLVPWLGLALWAFARPRPAPCAAAFAVAGAWLFAGFFLALGAASLRNATPLAPALALQAILFGGLLLLVPWLGGGRRAAALSAALLAAGVLATSAATAVI